MMLLNSLPAKVLQLYLPRLILEHDQFANFFHSFIFPFMKQIDNLMRTALLLCAIVLTATAAHALNTVPTVPICNPTPTGAPIDGGASLLLASGAAYAVRRLRKRKSQH